MGKISEFFWNNNLEWLRRWYGISVSGDMYSGHDFVESNGRVFFKVRLKTLLGNNKEGLNELEDGYVDEHLRAADPDDWAIGFVKPMSSKATIIEVLSKDMNDPGAPSISVHSGGISWIEGYDSTERGMEIRMASASSKYEDEYAITRINISVNDSDVMKMRPTLVLPDDSKYYVFFSKANGKKMCRSLYSVDTDGNVTHITDSDVLYGYNEDTVYLGEGTGLFDLDRRSGKMNDLYTTIPEITDFPAYIDANRNELFFYENPGSGHPAECALIGFAIKKQDNGYKVSKERVECPEVFADDRNPVIFDGKRYVWRVTSLWSGYKVFRRDASLKEKFLVEKANETAGTPVVFSTPSSIFIEWGTKDNPKDVRLSYSTNKGLCRMFATNAEAGHPKAIQPEDEDRI